MYKLVPNTTYQFRIWATNQLGRGAVIEKYATTLDIYNEQGWKISSNCDILVLASYKFILELARHLLDGADKFDTRIWAVAVGIVMGTLILLGLGTCFLLYQECRVPGGKNLLYISDHEVMLTVYCPIVKIDKTPQRCFKNS